MIVIKNNIIPFKGFKAITLWPFIFVRKEYPFNEVDLNHEKIHGRQQLELLIILFYIIYLIEWIVRLFMKGNAYRSISFEKEAYTHQYELDYLNKRKLFAQWL